MRNYLIMELSAIEATWVMPCYLLGKHFLAFVDVDLLVTDFFFFSIKMVMCACVCICVTVPFAFSISFFSLKR